MVGRQAMKGMNDSQGETKKSLRVFTTDAQTSVPRNGPSMKRARHLVLNRRWRHTIMIMGAILVGHLTIYVPSFREQCTCRGVFRIVVAGCWLASCGESNEAADDCTSYP
jgi:hypothetical protein